jgi:hypothetical protein
MTSSSNIGFGGVLLGVGVGWLLFKYIGVSKDAFSYLLIIAGALIVISSLISRGRKNEISDLIGGIIGGLFIAVIFSSIFGFTSFFPFSSSITGSGDFVTRTYDYQDFNMIDASYGFDVEITYDEDYSITVMIDDNVVDSLDVDKSGNTLSVGLNLGSYSNVNPKAFITMPNLYGVELSGGSQCDVSGFTSAHDFELMLSGGSQANIMGTAGDLKLDASGGSQVFLKDFIVNDANVEFSGGSQGTIHVQGTLEVNLSGGSRLSYYGDPELGDIDVSSGSTLIPK